MLVLAGKADFEGLQAQVLRPLNGNPVGTSRKWQGTTPYVMPVREECTELNRCMVGNACASKLSTALTVTRD
jgi:hypothetical protein